MVEPAPVLLTSRAEVASILSTVGIDLHIDDNDDGVVDLTEEQYLVDCMEEASDTIFEKLQYRYTHEVLIESDWTRRRVSYLAAHLVGKRRGNPNVFCEKVVKLMKEVDEVYNGQNTIPLTAPRDNIEPAMSNQVVDRRYRAQKLRTDQWTSTGGTDSRQHLDYYPYTRG